MSLHEGSKQRMVRDYIDRTKECIKEMLMTDNIQVSIRVLENAKHYVHMIHQFGEEDYDLEKRLKLAEEKIQKRIQQRNKR